MENTTPTGAAVEAPLALFDRLVCGVDGSPEGLEAVRQSLRLRNDGAPLAIVSVVDLAVAAEAGFVAAQVDAELRQAARDAVAAAEEEAAGAPLIDSSVLEGRTVPRLLEELKSRRATLVVVGSHETSRAVGILLGGVATSVLHDAPCSVLIARAPAEPGRLPSSIVVGIDGSPASERALAVADALAERYQASLRVLLGTGGKWMHEVDDLRLSQRRLEVVEAKPVDALAEASRAADLVVVGSRGVHGARALGSVSERVGHRAQCSVLVVR